MIVKHNMEASNTNRHLGITNRALSKSIEKLSSGYKINRAADNAAGLAISEEMRGQIRGLKRGAQNAEEGILFCNVADAGMQELENIIQRIRELCVQGANDTNVEEDRAAIQNEIDVLIEEVDRITDDTEYNTIKVFRPKMIQTTYEVDSGTGSWKTIQTISYEVKDNNYGITNVLGTKNIYSGTHLSYDLRFSGSGWNTTGNEFQYKGTVADMVTGTRTASTMSGKNWSDIATYLNTTYGANVSQYSNNSLETFVSSDGKTSIDVRYGYYDTTGKKFVSNVSISTYDKALTDADKQLSSRETLSFSGSGGKGYSSNGRFNATWLDFSGLGTDFAIESLDKEGFNSTCAHCSKPYSITLLAKSESATGLTTNKDGVGYKFNDSLSTPNLSVDISKCTTGEDIVKTIMSAVQSVPYMTNHLTQYAYNYSEPGKLYIYDNCSTYPVTENSSYGRWEPQARNTTESIPHIVTTQVWVPDKTKVVEYKEGEFNIQVGANSMQGVRIDKPWLSATILGVADVGVVSLGVEANDRERATDSISLCDGALDILNGKRSYIGAVTNRLAHAYDNDQNEAENLQNAESLLRDVNIGDEMTYYAAKNIILQAGQSMLAQANQSKNGIRNLLQG